MADSLPVATDVAADRRTAPRARLERVVRLFVAGVLAFAAGGKIFWPATFGELLRGYGLLPDAAVPILQWTLPALELAVALLLAARIGGPVAPATALFLGLTFTGAHALSYMLGSYVPCGCMGIGLSAGGESEHLLIGGLSIVLAGVSGWLLIASTPAVKRSLPRSACQPDQRPDSSGRIMPLGRSPDSTRSRMP